jgi:hypothetical protein
VYNNISRIVDTKYEDISVPGWNVGLSRNYVSVKIGKGYPVGHTLDQVLFYQAKHVLVISVNLESVIYSIWKYVLFNTFLFSKQRITFLRPHSQD